MAKSKEPINPFYLLVLLLGVVFAITSCAYGTMAYRAIAPAAGSEDGQGLMAFLDRYGVLALGGELVLLGAAALGAMGLDQWRTRQNDARGGSRTEPETEAELGPEIR